MKLQLLLVFLLIGFASAHCTEPTQETQTNQPTEEIEAGTIAIIVVLILVFAALLTFLILKLTGKEPEEEELETSYY